MGPNPFVPSEPNPLVSPHVDGLTPREGSLTGPPPNEREQAGQEQERGPCGRGLVGRRAALLEGDPLALMEGAGLEEATGFGPAGGGLVQGHPSAERATEEQGFGVIAEGSPLPTPAVVIGPPISISDAIKKMTGPNVVESGIQGVEDGKDIEHG